MDLVALGLTYGLLIGCLAHLFGYGLSCVKSIFKLR